MKRKVNLIWPNKANVNHENSDRNMALLPASENGDVTMVKLCLEDDEHGLISGSKWMTMRSSST